MAADTDNFRDDCWSDNGILSGEDGDNSNDSEEVQSLLTSIQSTRTEQRTCNTIGDELVPVSSCLSPSNTAYHSLIYI
jgi:hypothetical protein